MTTSASADPKPPSTGRELATGSLVMSPEQARDLAMVKIKDARSGAPCPSLANPGTALSFRLAHFTKADLVANLEPLVRIARCAEHERFFQLELELGMALDMFAGQHAELAARGALGLDRVELANKIMSQALRKAPKDPNVLVTASKIMCIRGNWKECELYAGDALQVGASMTDKTEKLAVASRAFKYGARASLHVGKLDKAEHLAAESEHLGGDKDDLAEIRDMLTQARENHALVEPTVDGELMLGIYHLYGKIENAGPLARLRITNMSDADTSYRVEVGITGITDKSVQQVSVGRGKDKELTFNPPLVASFQTASLRAPRAAQVLITVSTAGKTIYEQTHPVSIEPRDYLPVAVYDGKDTSHETPWFYAAWITPNARSIDGFLKKAKARVTGKVSGAFTGEQSDTFDQVKAIYEELQAMGMSYVMDPSVLAGGAHPQRTRLPSEVLQTTNAQCLEGTLLYATLLESIGLKPIIVRVPGHAFVGWFASPHDRPRIKPSHGMYFLETTLTHDASFDKAVEIGLRELEEHNSKKQATLYDVSQLRKNGVTAQPSD